MPFSRIVMLFGAAVESIAALDSSATGTKV